MSPNHISTIVQKHQDVESAIHQELTRPKPNMNTVKELKVKRLRLKEHIDRLRTD